MTVAEMLRRMSSRELSEWQAYFNLEPWGEERADLRAGMSTAPLLNLWIKKGKRRAKPSDWIMRFGPKEPQDPEEMAMMLRGLAAAAKAANKRRQRHKKKQPRKRRRRR